MNVLLICGLALAAVIAVAFFIGLSKSSALTCLVCFILMLALCCTAIVALSLPPKTETWQVSFVNGNNITLYNGKENVSLDITKINRVAFQYVNGTRVQLTRDILGTPIFLTPADYVIVPSSK